MNDRNPAWTPDESKRVDDIVNEVNAECDPRTTPEATFREPSEYDRCAFPTPWGRCEAYRKHHYPGSDHQFWEDPVKTIEDFKSPFHLAVALYDAGMDDRNIAGIVESMRPDDDSGETAGAAVYRIANGLEDAVKKARGALAVAESELKAFCSVVELEPVNA